MTVGDGSISVPVSTRKVEGYAWTENRHHLKLEEFSSKDSKSCGSSLGSPLKLSCKNFEGAFPENPNSVMQILVKEIWKFKKNSFFLVTSHAGYVQYHVSRLSSPA